MSTRKTYVVLVPFKHRGHWTAKDDELQLLAVEAAQLVTAGRLALKSDATAPAAAAATTTTRKKG